MVRLLLGALLPSAACQAATQPAVVTVPPSVAAAVATPSRPVELVVAAPRGGALDADARALVSAIENNQLSAEPVQIVNRDGDALSYLAAQRGDMHRLLLSGSGLLATMASQSPAALASDVTPIATIAVAPSLLWVSADSPWRGVQDFIAAARAAPLTVAGLGARGDDEVLFRRVQALATTRPFTYIAHAKESDALAALAAHQSNVSATASGGHDGLSLFQASPRKIRPLCAFAAVAPTAGAYAGIPTCAAGGLPIDDACAIRMIVGPPELTPAQQGYWAEVLRRAAGSAEWMRYAQDSDIRPDFRASTEVQQLFGRCLLTYRDVAIANGWSK